MAEAVTVDQQAAEQIKQLFQAKDHRVWELLQDSKLAPAKSVAIRTAGGCVVAYACPAP